jgi:hypothetical protein
VSLTVNVRQNKEKLKSLRKKPPARKTKMEKNTVLL